MPSRSIDHHLRPASRTKSSSQASSRGAARMAREANVRPRSFGGNVKKVKLMRNIVSSLTNKELARQLSWGQSAVEGRFPTGPPSPMHPSPSSRPHALDDKTPPPTPAADLLCHMHLTHARMAWSLPCMAIWTPITISSAGLSRMAWGGWADSVARGRTVSKHMRMGRDVGWEGGPCHPRDRLCCPSNLHEACI